MGCGAPFLRREIEYGLNRTSECRGILVPALFQLLAAYRGGNDESDEDMSCGRRRGCLAVCDGRRPCGPACPVGNRLPAGRIRYDAPDYLVRALYAVVHRADHAARPGASGLLYREVPGERQPDALAHQP